MHELNCDFVSGLGSEVTGEQVADYLNKHGSAADKKETDFDPVQLSAGILVEMEHSENYEVAKQIAMDHLVEDPNYYSKYFFPEEAKGRITDEEHLGSVETEDDEDDEEENDEEDDSGDVSDDEEVGIEEDETEDITEAFNYTDMFEDYHGNINSESTKDIKVEHEGILDVPEGKKFYDLPISHFVNLGKKIGKDKVMRALLNLERWNKKKDPSLSKKARHIIDAIKESYDPSKLYQDLKDNDDSIEAAKLGATGIEKEVSGVTSAYENDTSIIDLLSPVSYDQARVAVDSGAPVYVYSKSKDINTNIPDFIVEDGNYSDHFNNMENTEGYNYYTLKSGKDLAAADEKPKDKNKYNGANVTGFDTRDPMYMKGPAPANGNIMARLYNYLLGNTRISSGYHTLLRLAPNKDLIKSSLSGNIDNRLYKRYYQVNPDDATGSYLRILPSTLLHLVFSSKYGFQTVVDLEALDTGYIVEDINDELGMFAAGTEKGDFIPAQTMEFIVAQQAMRDKTSGEREAQADLA